MARNSKVRSVSIGKYYIDKTAWIEFNRKNKKARYGYTNNAYTIRPSDATRIGKLTRNYTDLYIRFTTHEHFLIQIYYERLFGTFFYHEKDLYKFIYFFGLFVFLVASLISGG